MSSKDDLLAALQGFKQDQNVESQRGAFGWAGGEPNNPILEHQLDFGTIDIRGAKRLSMMRQPNPRHEVRFSPDTLVREKSDAYGSMKKSKEFRMPSRYKPDRRPNVKMGSAKRGELDKALPLDLLNKLPKDQQP